MLPAVSIILPTCDRPELVSRALASILGQTFCDFEVLLVDANRRSPPVPENAHLAPLLADPRVLLLDGRNTQNAAAARNVGLDAAAGGWIAFLDDDDEYRPQKIAAQYALAQQTGAALVLCGYEFVWPHRRRRRQTKATSFDGDQIVTCAYLGSPALFHSRDEVLRFDETLFAGEDVPYALHFIARHGVRNIPNVPETLFAVHPQRGASVHADKEAAWRACRASWRIARPHFSGAARRTLLAHGRLERAMGGHGSFAHFLHCVLAVVRTRGPVAWRLAVYAMATRLRG